MTWLVGATLGGVGQLGGGALRRCDGLSKFRHSPAFVRFSHQHTTIQQCNIQRL